MSPEHAERAGRLVDEIVRVFAERGGQAYLGEQVSMAEHMLQSARAAERDGAAPALVAAALLHDVGHLVHGMADDPAADLALDGIDTVHEEAGARWLARAFGPEVTEPIRLHVAAKRYLCATDPAYLAVLSPASVRTLELQGGPFGPADAEAFAALPHAADAVRVRRWDDAGKVAGGDANEGAPSIDEYRALLVALVRPDAAAA